MKAEIHTLAITHTILIIAETKQEGELLAQFAHQEGTPETTLRHPTRYKYPHLEIRKEQ